MKKFSFHSVIESRPVPSCPFHDCSLRRLQSSSISSMATGSMPLAHPNQSNRDSPVVFLDIAIGEQPAGRIVIELRSDVAPKTAENFRQLCTGEFRPQNDIAVGYRTSTFHRVIKDFMIQGGDIVCGDGTGSISIYGQRFDDENFDIKHDRAGILSSANSGPNTNGCQFFITCAPAPWLDGRHCAFGIVIDGLLTVRKIEAVPVGKNGKPRLPVVITQCGEL